MKRKDIILIAILLLIVGVFILINKKKDENKGKYAEFYVDNKLYRVEPLNETKRFTIRNNGKINKVYIHNGGVEFTYANCPDKVCVHTGFISKPSESIICIPNKVQVKIKGEKAPEDVDVNTN